MNKNLFNKSTDQGSGLGIRIQDEQLIPNFIKPLESVEFHRPKNESLGLRQLPVALHAFHVGL